MSLISLRLTSRDQSKLIDYSLIRDEARIS